MQTQHGFSTSTCTRMLHTIIHGCRIISSFLLEGRGTDLCVLAVAVNSMGPLREIFLKVVSNMLIFTHQGEVQSRLKH